MIGLDTERRRRTAGWLPVSPPGVRWFVPEVDAESADERML